jgi:hypothetical protein
LLFLKLYHPKQLGDLAFQAIDHETFNASS